MAMTLTQKIDMYRFFAIAFDAAPGVTYMNQLDQALASGMTTKQVVNQFTTKAEFTAVYPAFLDNGAFATKLVNNVVGSSANDAAKASAVADIQAALTSGYSRGDVIYQVFNNLANKPFTDPVWGGTAKEMANQVVVAQYYTETMMGDTTSVPTLRAVIANVTSTTDVSTTAAVSAILTAAAIYPFAITAASTGVNEGSAAVFNVTGGAPLTTYIYSVGGNVGAADITTSLLGSMTTDASGKGVISVTTVADRLTEGSELMTVGLNGTTLVASTVVNDTSLNNRAPAFAAATQAVAATEDTLSLIHI